MALVQAEGLSKSFGVVRALNGVELVVQSGSVHAVVGHNGAGKSTLMNILSGVYPPDAGRIRIDGEDVRFASPRDALHKGVSMVHQELSVIPDLDVAENIFLGREPITTYGGIRRGELYTRTASVLHDLGLDISGRDLCATLSVGSRQMIEIAQAVSRQSRLLILDEPTSALTEHEQKRLFAFIKRLQAMGLGVLYVSHKLDEVQLLSDTVTVLRDGALVCTLPTRELDPGRMVELMVGRSVTLGSPTVAPSDAIGFEVAGLEAKDAGIHEVSFSARKGEILGLAGMLGSGRTELFETLFGLRRFESGTIRIGDNRVRPSSPRQAMSERIALVPEDRRNQGIFSGLPVWKNITFATFHDLFRATLGLVRENQARAAARVEVKRLNVATPSIYQEIQLLSGGNQQKVILARWLLREPHVLLLDDPTAGVDIGAKSEIHAIVRNLAARGLTVIMSSSEFPELLEVCHRVLVIRKGRIVAEVDPRATTEAELVHAASSGDVSPSLIEGCQQ
jgi:ABC-type sugar transport system ATPase subunit